MKPSPKKLRPPTKRHGGKFFLARQIVECFPEHVTYCEPFLGGGSVLLAKPKAEREVVGDLDVCLIRMWLAIRDNPLDLATLVDGIAYTETNFRAACDFLASGEEEWGFLDHACAYLVRSRFSRGGMGKTFAWSDRLRGGKPGDANAWDTIREELPAISERVRDVAIYCRDAIGMIPELDGPDTLFYLDPPYLHSTRTARKAYEHEMGQDDHFSLLAMLTSRRGQFFLSGYRSLLYDEFAEDNGWHRVEWDLPNRSSQAKAKQRRTEVLWSNRPFPGSVPCEAEEAARA